MKSLALVLCGVAWLAGQARPPAASAVHDADVITAVYEQVVKQTGLTGRGYTDVTVSKSNLSVCRSNRPAVTPCVFEPSPGWTELRWWTPRFPEVLPPAREEMRRSFVLRNTAAQDLPPLPPFVIDSPSGQRGTFAAEPAVRPPTPTRIARLMFTLPGYSGLGHALLAVKEATEDPLYLIVLEHLDGKWTVRTKRVLSKDEYRDE